MTPVARARQKVTLPIVINPDYGLFEAPIGGLIKSTIPISSIRRLKVEATFAVLLTMGVSREPRTHLSRQHHVLTQIMLCTAPPGTFCFAGGLSRAPVIPARWLQ
jgi:hypothetical protein